MSSDVKYLVENADDATADGITIVKTTKIGSNYMITFSESTKTSGAYYPNAELGWYYLMANYFKYFADAESGTVNGAAFTFDHVKEFLRQDGVSYFPSASIDWRKPFTLSNGTGWIISYEYSPETGMAVINVGFNPYE